ncbi:hypothetical protein C8F01DRAFT_1372212 [Mycena amicta]|nr:hypothetical protein C8F01DRAFT_1372212 [Mycena amicta]
MTATDAITIIFDDVLAVDFKFSSPGVAENPSDVNYPIKYNNTIAVFNMSLQAEQNVPLRSFDGSTVQLYGIAPPLLFNQTFIIERFLTGPDTTAAPQWQYLSYHAPGYGGLHYTSPPNSTTDSALFVAQAQSFGLDYAVVTVYPTTELLGTTILVDDSSSSLIWRGSWTEENNFTLPIPCDLPLLGGSTSSSPPSDVYPFKADLAPHANTTHASQTKGDEFEFWFTGTSISVYGVTPSIYIDNALAPWLLQMSFTLDAAEPIIVNITPQEFIYEQPHFLYFNASSIPAGNHSLVGTIVDVVGSTLPRARIDYITYKPSFASQVEMPVLPPFASTTTATSSTTTATSITSSTSSSDAGSIRSTKAKITSAAVGGAVGAVMLCGLAIVLLLYMRRRRRRNRNLHQVDEPFSGTSKPFSGSSATGYIIGDSQKRGTMRLGNDTATPELRTVAQEPVHAGPPAAEHLSQPLVDTPAVHRDGLEQLPVGPPQGNTEMDSRFRELQDRMEQLTQEVREQILPPAYEGDAT